MANCKTEDERRKTEELIRPILRGRDIKRYGYEWANLYLIATFPARHYNINDYPAIKDYLLSFAEDNLRDAGYDWVADHYLADFCKQKLSQTGKFVEIKGERIILGNTPEKARKKTSNKWFETQDSISYWEDFFQPKIVYGQFQDGAEYSFAESGVFLSSNEYMLITHHYSSKCLLAFLNSKASEWLLGQLTGNLGCNAKIGQKSNFLKLSIAQLNVERQKLFEGYVDSILGNIEDAKNYEALIDREIYKVYGLTVDEIKVIESQ